MASSSREALIRQLARKYSLDPNAVVAIANVEGRSALHGGNSIGDHGTSFGPFQLHAGGALPKGKGNNWANSPSRDRVRGVAHDGSARTPGPGCGASDLAALRAPGRRPRRGLEGNGLLRANSIGPVTYPPSSDGKGGLGPIRSNPFGIDPKSVIVQTLLQASSDAAQGKTPDFGGILAIAQARQQAQAAHDDPDVRAAEHLSAAVATDRADMAQKSRPVAPPRTARRSSRGPG